MYHRLTLKASQGSSTPADGTALTEAKQRLKSPPRYQVILLNDDYTPMDFVIHVLQYFFCMDMELATRVMLTVHTQGKGICGVFSKDVAESKAAQVNRYSRENQHPLLCEIELADGDED